MEINKQELRDDVDLILTKICKWMKVEGISEYIRDEIDNKIEAQKILVEKKEYDADGDSIIDLAEYIAKMELMYGVMNGYHDTAKRIREKIRVLKY